jgi:hypothetical protein
MHGSGLLCACVLSATIADNTPGGARVPQWLGCHCQCGLAKLNSHGAFKVQHREVVPSASAVGAQSSTGPWTLFACQWPADGPSVEGTARDTVTGPRGPGLSASGHRGS